MLTDYEKLAKVKAVIDKWGISSIEGLYQTEKFALKYAEILGEICRIVGWHEEEDEL